MKSKILVGLQFFIIFLMIIPLGNTTSYAMAGMGLFAAGMVVGLMAIVQHKRGNFNIRPDIKEGCVLVQEGIYRYIRHPMYLSVLMMMGGFVFLYPTWYEMILYTTLVAVLLTKLLYEESLWQCHTPEYEVYKRKTKRLIPFVF
jgi:protein-S-isoprenylcysteine O-methyltransferase Ste14